jgi:serine/threonine protein kinase
MTQDDADSTLPPGWTKHWSNSWQKHYWFNSKTGKQSWEHPGAAGAEAAQGAPAAQAAAGDKRKAFEPAAEGDAGSPRPQAAAMPCAPRLSLVATGATAAAVGSPPPPTGSPLRLSGGDDTGLSVGNNFLDQLARNTHPWAFGAFAELIQNSDDAGSKNLSINYQHATDGTGTLPEMLIFEDDGEGMTSESMSWCFQLGSNRGVRAKDDTISGQYGVGFKQGVLRLGHTALVISRSEGEKCISVGILSNLPYERHGQAPICQHTSLTLRGEKRPGHPEVNAVILSLNEVIAFNASVWVGMELGKRVNSNPGTTVYIFGVEHRNTDHQKTQEMLINDQDDEPDICLRGAGGLLYKRKESCKFWRHADIPLESSLRAYLKLLFFKSRMTISLLGKKVETPISMQDEIPNFQAKCLRAGSDDGKSPPIIGYVGVSEWHKERKLCGSFFYTANCLIKSYDYDHELVKATDSHLHGVIMLVPMQKEHVKVTPNKQDYEEQAYYPGLLSKASGYMHDYAHPGEKVSPAALQQGHYIIEKWVQCLACQKWRMCDDEFMRIYGGDNKFTCDMHELVRKEAKEDFKCEHNPCEVPDHYERLRNGQLPPSRANPSSPSVLEDRIHWIDTDLKSESGGAGSSCSIQSASGSESAIQGAATPVTSVSDTMLIKVSDFSYDDKKELGSGRFATVFCGTFRGQKAAVKVFKDLELEVFQKSFEKEKMASDLTRNRFPNIVHYMGFCIEKKTIVMELVDEAKNLKALMEDGHKLPNIAGRLEIMIQVASGVEALHELKLIHRDLKPENVLCSGDLSTVKITDFGISKLIANADTQTGGIFADFLSVGYCAPEQESGAIPTPAVDVWAFAIMLLEMCVCEEEEEEKEKKVQTRVAKELWSGDGGSRMTREQIARKKREYCQKSSVSRQTHLITMLPHFGILLKQKCLGKVAKQVLRALDPNPKDRQSIIDCKKELEDVLFALDWEQCHGGGTTIFHTIEPADIWSRSKGTLTRKCNSEHESEKDLLEHVKDGSEDCFSSRFLSCSLDFDFCVHYYQVQRWHKNAKKKSTFDGVVILEIDVTKVPRQTLTRYDLSTKTFAQRCFQDVCGKKQPILAVNSAVCAREVVFDLTPKVTSKNGKLSYECKIPKEAIVAAYDMSTAHVVGNNYAAALCYLVGAPDRKCKLSNFKEWKDLLRKDRLHGLNSHDSWMKIKESARVPKNSAEWGSVQEKCAQMHKEYWEREQDTPRKAGKRADGKDPGTDSTGGRGFGGHGAGGRPGSGGAASKRPREASANESGGKRSKVGEGTKQKDTGKGTGGASGSAAGGGVGRGGGGGPVDLRAGGLHVSAAPGSAGGVPSPVSVGTQGHAHASRPGAGVSGGLSVAAKPLPSIPKKKQPSAVAVTVEKSGGSSGGGGHTPQSNGITSGFEAKVCVV